MKDNKSQRKTSFIVSAIHDGIVVETVYRPNLAKTAFVVAKGEQVEIIGEWRSNDVTYAPVRPTNNLIKHGALVLPSGPADYVDTGALLLEVKTYIRKYVALAADAAEIATAYVLLSWVYDAFNELPYLRFRGDYGTGKTRALLVIGSLCYKAFFASGASTVSPIFHTLDTFKGTLIFDEADFRFTDEKAELVKILNNGNVKGFPVLRTQVTPQKEFDPRAFSIFGPKIVGMRRAYDDRALESRFLTIEMEPGHSAGVPINLPDAQKNEALSLRNKLLAYRLRNRLSTKLDPSLADQHLEPRMNQILLPLLSIVTDGSLRAAIRGMAVRLQASIVSERGISSDGQVLAIVSQLTAAPWSANLSLAKVTTAFIEQYGSEYQRPITNRWVGTILRRLGIQLYKSNGVFVLAPGQKERIKALGERYGVGREVTADDEVRAA